MKNKQSIYRPPIAVIYKTNDGNYHAVDKWGNSIPKEILEQCIVNCPENYTLEDYEVRTEAWRKMDEKGISHGAE